MRAFAADRIEVRSAPDIEGTGAAVEVERVAGAPVGVRRAVPKGDSDDPLAETEIVDKFRLSARGILTEASAEDALGLLLAVDELDDVDRLMASLRVEDPTHSDGARR